MHQDRVAPPQSSLLTGSGKAKGKKANIYLLCARLQVPVTFEFPSSTHSHKTGVAVPVFQVGNEANWLAQHKDNTMVTMVTMLSVRVEANGSVAAAALRSLQGLCSLAGSSQHPAIQGQVA